MFDDLFLCYAANIQNIEDIIMAGVIAYENGENFSFDADNLSMSDIEYIRNEIEKRCNS